MSLLSRIYAIPFFSSSYRFHLHHVLTFFIYYIFVLSDDTNKRRSLRSRDSKDVEKAVNNLIQDRSSSCKIPALKLVLIIIICGTFLTLIHSPAVYITDHPTNSGSRYLLLSTLVGFILHFLWLRLY